jgi:hypothetical protein
MNFGVTRINSGNRGVFSEITLTADWNAAVGPSYVPKIPPGIPSLGPYTPVDVVGPASVRNSPGNLFDVYNYTSSKAAAASTRIVPVVATIPGNNAGVTCPKPN